MHTIKLKIHDDIYSHIMFLLKSQDKKKLEIVEDISLLQKNKKAKRRLNSIQINTSNFKFDREEANAR
jgi:hypothetical protein